MSKPFGTPDPETLAELRRRVSELRADCAAAESLWAPQIERVDDRHGPSALNLVHYWALRRHDLRGLQSGLAAVGLSSLGRSESHVLASLGAVTRAIDALAGRGDGPVRDVPSGESAEEPLIGLAGGRRLLRRRAVALLGPSPEGRESRIMVTLPAAAAGDPRLVRSLAEHGMDMARINCAHDGPETWERMIRHTRAAGAAVGRDIDVAMDLGGPKLRTGPLVEGPTVVRLRPVRDLLGRVFEPARCRLGASGTADPGEDLPVLPVPVAWATRRRPGETIRLRDTRDAERRLVIESVGDGGATASCEHTAYIATGTVLRAHGDADVSVGPLPPVPLYLTLRRGDTLILTRDCRPVPVSSLPARIGCTMPQVFGHVRPGQDVWFDDGKIGGTVVSSGPDEIEVSITRARRGGSRLRAGKGINFPESTLPVSALGEQDRTDLRFVSAHADLVGISFVREASDIADLLRELDDLGDARLGVVVKIETVRAFENLPEILLTAMRRPRVGVMIARGDLAVECGYQRLAELQEEILWLCEAAHLPAIWATQVLDRMARSGIPSRAEITDAAMSARAECVMLNKGPYIVEAVIVLDDILRRMTTHQDKKDTLLRSLKSWRAADGAGGSP
ncbi:pyruvate kinase [Actinomadura macra]|uniref:pyruvate kinase n=1 Tax=Actinomadura macra TaxID=46164 RepID=UPI000A047D0C|nr:pyruvate kinase [Actinomadura macra]